MKHKAKKPHRSAYDVAPLDKPELGFLRDLSRQSPAEFVDSVEGASGSVGKIYRIGNKRILTGLAYVYAVYAELQVLPSHRRDELLQALATSTGKRARTSGGGGEAQPVHHLLRGLIDYGRAYSSGRSARQALHRDANALRYAWKNHVPAGGFLDFATKEGLGAEAMSHAFVDLLAEERKMGSGQGNPGKGPEAVSPASKVSSPSTKTFILEIDGQKSTLAAPVAVGARGGFHFFGTVSEKGEVVVTGTAPAEFNPSGQATRRSLSGLKSQVQRAESAARSAEREATAKTAIKKKAGRG